MADELLRGFTNSRHSSRFGDPLYESAVASAETRTAYGFVDVPGYSYGDDNGDVPVTLRLTYASEGDSEQWRVEVRTYTIHGERETIKRFDTKFVGKAVFEWMVSEYNLTEGIPNWDGVSEEEVEEEEPSLLVKIFS